MCSYLRISTHFSNMMNYMIPKELVMEYAV